MKRYLLPSEAKQNKEESQWISKLRSKMTDLKMNYKGIYDSYECEDVDWRMKARITY